VTFEEQGHVALAEDDVGNKFAVSAEHARHSMAAYLQP
jgi:hypothetical protein